MIDTKKAKEMICDISRRLYDKNFVAANDGNISYRLSDQEIWVTPTGVSKGFVTEDMLVKVDIDGNILEGNRNPSSEVKMHLEILKNRKDIDGVVHAHPPMATISAIRRRDINMSYLPEGIMNLGEVKVTDYATPSTDQVPESIRPFIKNNAVLLANHGALTWGKDLIDAYYKMEILEYMANINYKLDMIKDGIELNEKEIADILDLRGFYADYMAKK